MTMYLVVLMIVTLGLVILGRFIGDQAGKKLDTENKAKLIDVQNPYWLLPGSLLTILVLLLVMNSVEFLWLFLAVSLVNLIYSIVVVALRRKRLIAKDFPEQFVKIRTISIILQMLSSVVFPIGVYFVFENMLK